MGSFEGHVLPGTLFFLFGLTHAVAIWRRYFRAIYAGDAYVNKASLTVGRWPVEAIVKLLAAGGGIIAEVATGWPTGAKGSGVPMYAENEQHVTMYSFFLFSAWADIAVACRANAVPPKMDYLMAMLAFGVEGFLFRWHQHGNSMVDTQVHTFLLYAIALCIVSGVFEMCRPNDHRPALARATFIMLQGTWFWEIAFVLYPVLGVAPLNQDSHRAMMFVTNSFAWHVFFVIALTLAIGAVSYRCAKTANGGRPPPQALADAGYRPIAKRERDPDAAAAVGQNGSIVIDFSDDEDDLEDLRLAT